MSDLLFKLCPRCKRLFPVGNGSSLCSECAEKKRVSRKRDRDYKKEYQERRDTEDPRFRSFYRSKEWRMTSAKYLQSVGYRSEECDSRCPKCGNCAGWAEDVHHIVPIQEPDGWEMRFDFKNLKALCVHMHNKEHGRTFNNKWGGDYAGRKAEEAARHAKGPSNERGEGREAGGGGRVKVSDFR